MENNTSAKENRNNRKKLLFVLLPVFCILIIVGIVIGINSKKNDYSAVTMRLQRLVGDVDFFKKDGKPHELQENMKLNSGESIITAAQSLIMVALDETKLVTMEENSKADILKDGKALQIDLKEGNIFFNVTEKLDADASFDIRTGNMLCGIRGTSGVDGFDSEGHEQVMGTDGVIHFMAVHSRTGEVVEGDIEPGNKAKIFLDEEAEGDASISITQEKFREEDLPPVALDAMTKSEALMDRVTEATGFSSEKIDRLAEITSTPAVTYVGSSAAELESTGIPDSMPLMGQPAQEMNDAANAAVDMAENDLDLEMAVLTGLRDVLDVGTENGYEKEDLSDLMKTSTKGMEKVCKSSKDEGLKKDTTIKAVELASGALKDTTKKMVDSKYAKKDIVDAIAASTDVLAKTINDTADLGEDALLAQMEEKSDRILKAVNNTANSVELTASIQRLSDGDVSEDLVASVNGDDQAAGFDADENGANAANIENADARQEQEASAGANARGTAPAVAVGNTNNQNVTATTNTVQTPTAAPALTYGIVSQPSSQSGTSDAASTGSGTSDDSGTSTDRSESSSGSSGGSSSGGSSSGGTSGAGGSGGSSSGGSSGAGGSGGSSSGGSGGSSSGGSGSSSDSGSSSSSGSSSDSGSSSSSGSSSDSGSSSSSGSSNDSGSSSSSGSSSDSGSSGSSGSSSDDGSSSSSGSSDDSGSSGGSSDSGSDSGSDSSSGSSSDNPSEDPEVTTYTVTLNTNGGTINSGNVTSYTTGTAVTLPTDVTKTADAGYSYSFDGWYTQSEGGDKVTAIASSDSGDKTFYAHWASNPKSYAVSVTPGSNGTAVAKVGENTVTEAAVGSTVTLVATPNTYYEFKKWSDLQGNSVISSLTENPATFTMPSGAVSFSAEFAPKSYAVTLNTQGGTINSGNVTSYTYGTGATLPSDVTKAEDADYTYAYDGWWTDATAGTNVSSISATDSGDKTFYAHWNSTAKLSISVEAETGGSVVPKVNGSQATKAKPGDTVTVTAAANTGYRFERWDDVNKNTDVSDLHSETLSFTMPSSVVSLRAMFMPETYGVTLNAQGGSIPSDELVEYYTYGEGATLPTGVSKDWTDENEFTFLGWYTEASGGTRVESISATDYGDKTFYAQWQTSARTYSITYNVDDRLSAQGNANSAAVGSSVEAQFERTQQGSALISSLVNGVSAVVKLIGQTVYQLLFTMPAQNTTVDMASAESTTFRIEINSSIEDAVLVNGASEGATVAPDDKAVAIVEAIDGYELYSFAIEREGSDLVQIPDEYKNVDFVHEESGNAYEFTMPPTDVTITATFKQIDYEVTFANNVEGVNLEVKVSDEIATLTNNKIVAHYGDEITIVTSGGDGTDELIVSYLNPEGDSETVEGGDGIYILSMPAYSLTVTISR